MQSTCIIAYIFIQIASTHRSMYALIHMDGLCLYAYVILINLIVSRNEFKKKTTGGKVLRTKVELRKSREMMNTLLKHFLIPLISCFWA